MTQTAIQNQIIELVPFVENKKILKAIYTIIEKEANLLKLSKEQMDELDRREESYLKGEGKSYTWDEVQERILGEKNV